MYQKYFNIVSHLIAKILLVLFIQFYFIINIDATKLCSAADLIFPITIKHKVLFSKKTKYHVNSRITSDDGNKNNNHEKLLKQYSLLHSNIFLAFSR